MGEKRKQGNFLFEFFFRPALSTSLKKKKKTLSQSHRLVERAPGSLSRTQETWSSTAENKQLPSAGMRLMKYPSGSSAARPSPPTSALRAEDEVERFCFCFAAAAEEEFDDVADELDALPLLPPPLFFFFAAMSAERAERVLKALSAVGRRREKGRTHYFSFCLSSPRRR